MSENSLIFFFEKESVFPISMRAYISYPYYKVFSKWVGVGALDNPCAKSTQNIRLNQTKKSYNKVNKSAFEN